MSLLQLFGVQERGSGDGRVSDGDIEAKKDTKKKTVLTVTL